MTRTRLNALPARPAATRGPGVGCAARCAMAPSTLGSVPVGAKRSLFVAPFVAEGARGVVK